MASIDGFSYNNKFSDSIKYTWLSCALDPYDLCALDVCENEGDTH